MLHPSDSSEQQQAETPTLVWLNNELKASMSRYATILPSGIRIQIDGYDPIAKVACEIYSRIGELKPAQKHKIANDIFKLLWFERQLGEPLKQKVICFASDEAAKVLDNASWLAAAAKEFGVTFLVVRHDPSVVAGLRLAQQRQVR